MMISPRLTSLVQVLLAIQSCLTVAKGQLQLQPTIGDIRLEKYSPVSDFYEVLVYYSDGIQPPEWGGICSGISIKTAGVICKQLGYKLPQESPTTYGDTGRPVWLKKVKCSSNIYSHILRCEHTVVTGDERNNSLSCGNERQRQLIRCDFSTGLDPYDGEIRLCPPDNINNDQDNITSISYGIVALHFHSEWRGVTQISEDTKALLGSTEADAICRQLGYTDAVVGSAVAINATGYSFGQCYEVHNRLEFYLHLNSWMTTEMLTCKYPLNCFKCCYDDPPDTGCDDNLCDSKPRQLVIGCTIDPSKLKSLEPQEQCDLTPSNLQCSDEVCSSEKKTMKKLLGGFGFSLAVSLLINVIILILFLCECRFQFFSKCCRKYPCCRRYCCCLGDYENLDHVNNVNNVANNGDNN